MLNHSVYLKKSFYINSIVSAGPFVTEKALPVGLINSKI